MASMRTQSDQYRARGDPLTASREKSIPMDGNSHSVSSSGFIRSTDTLLSKRDGVKLTKDARRTEKISNNSRPTRSSAEKATDLTCPKSAISRLYPETPEVSDSIISRDTYSNSSFSHSKDVETAPSTYKGSRKIIEESDYESLTSNDPSVLSSHISTGRDASHKPKDLEKTLPSRSVRSSESRNLSSSIKVPASKIVKAAAQKESNDVAFAINSRPLEPPPKSLTTKPEKSVSFDDSADRESHISTSRRESVTSRESRPTKSTNASSSNSRVPKTFETPNDPSIRGINPNGKPLKPANRALDDRTAAALEYIASKSSKKPRKEASPSIVLPQRGILPESRSAKTIKSARPSPPSTPGSPSTSVLSKSRHPSSHSNDISNQPSRAVTETDFHGDHCRRVKSQFESSQKDNTKKEPSQQDEIFKKSLEQSNQQKEQRNKDDGIVEIFRHEEAHQKGTLEDETTKDTAQRGKWPHEKEFGKDEMCGKGVLEIETQKERSRPARVLPEHDTELLENVPVAPEVSRESPSTSASLYPNNVCLDGPKWQHIKGQGVSIEAEFSDPSCDLMNSIKTSVSASHGTRRNSALSMIDPDLKGSGSNSDNQQIAPNTPSSIDKLGLEPEQELLYIRKGLKQILEGNDGQSSSQKGLKSPIVNGRGSEAKGRTAKEVIKEQNTRHVPNTSEEPLHIKKKEAETDQAKRLLELKAESQNVCVSSVNSSPLLSSWAPSTSSAYTYPSETHKNFFPSYMAPSHLFTDHSPLQSPNYAFPHSLGNIPALPYLYGPQFSCSFTGGPSSVHSGHNSSIPGSPLVYQVQSQAPMPPNFDLNSFNASPPPMDLNLRTSGTDKYFHNPMVGDSINSRVSSGLPDLTTLPDRCRAQPNASEENSHKAESSGEFNRRNLETGPRGPRKHLGGSKYDHIADQDLLKRELIDLKQKLQETVVDRDQLQDKVAQLDRKEKEIETICSERAEEKDKNERETKKFELKIKELDAACQSYRVETEKLQNENANLNSKQEELESTIKTALERKNAIQIKNTDLEKAIQSAREAEKVHEKEQQTLQMEIDELQSKQKSLNAIRGDEAAERENLHNEIESLKEELKEIGKSKAEVTEKAQKLKKEIDELRGKLKSTSLDRESISKEKDQLKRDCENGNKRIKEIVSQLKSADSINGSLKGDLTSLQEKLEIVLTKHKETQEELIKVKEINDTAVSELKTRAHTAEQRGLDLEDKLSSILERSETLVHEHNEALQAMAKVKEEAEASVVEMTELKDTAEREKIRLAVEFERLLHESKEELEEYRIESSAAFAKEKEDLKTISDAKLEEVENATREAKITHHEQVERLEKELKDALAILGEKEALLKQTGDDLLATKQKATENIESLRNQFEEERAALEKKMREIQTALESQLKEEREVFEKDTQQLKEEFAEKTQDAELATKIALDREKANGEDELNKERVLKDTQLLKIKEQSEKRLEEEKSNLEKEFNEAKEQLEKVIEDLKVTLQHATEERKTIEKQLKDDKEVLKAQIAGDKSTAEELLQEQKEELEKMLHDQKAAAEKDLENQKKEWKIKLDSEREILEQLNTKAIEELKSQHLQEKEDLQKQRKISETVAAENALQERSILEASHDKLESLLREERERNDAIEAEYQTHMDVLRKNSEIVSSEASKLLDVEREAFQAERKVFRDEIEELQKQTQDMNKLKLEKTELENRLHEQEQEWTKNLGEETKRSRKEVEEVQNQLNGKESEFKTLLANKETVDGSLETLRIERDLLINEKMELENTWQERETKLTKTLEEEKQAIKEENERLIEEIQNRILASNTEKEHFEAKWKEKEAELMVINEEKEGFSNEKQTLEASWKKREEELLVAAEQEKNQLVRERDHLLERLTEACDYKNSPETYSEVKGLLPEVSDSASMGGSAILSPEAETLKRQLEELQEQRELEKSDMEKTILEIKQKSGIANGAILKNLDALGVRSKGNDYYHEAFCELQEHIWNFSLSICTKLPNPKPRVAISLSDRLAAIFFLDTVASQQVRASFIAHKISSIITTRVFTPFAFAIGTESAETDDLLNNISTHLSLKSPDREAIWRHCTFDAAFRGEKSKGNINFIAAAVVNDLTETLKQVSDNEGHESISKVVENIVKSAFEIWRFARLERQNIVARMPTASRVDANDDQSFIAQDFETDSYHEVLDDKQKEDRPREILLGLYPVIELVNADDFLEDGPNDNSRIRSVLIKGAVLYSNAPPVLACEEAARRTHDTNSEGRRSVLDKPPNNKTSNLSKDAQYVVEEASRSSLRDSTNVDNKRAVPEEEMSDHDRNLESNPRENVTNNDEILYNTKVVAGSTAPSSLRETDAYEITRDKVKSGSERGTNGTQSLKEQPAIKEILGEIGFSIDEFDGCSNKQSGKRVPAKPTLQRSVTLQVNTENATVHSTAHRRAKSKPQNVRSISEVLVAQDDRAISDPSGQLNCEESTIKRSSSKRPSSIKIPNNDRSFSSHGPVKTPSGARHQLLWTDSSSAGVKGLYANSNTLNEKGSENPASPTRLARTLRRMTTGGSKPNSRQGSRQGSRASSRNPADRRDVRSDEDIESPHL